MSVKRLRILAGPNGSGKTTVYKDIIKVAHFPFGVFVNADEIELCLRTKGCMSFEGYGINVEFEEFLEGYKSFPKSKESLISENDFIIRDNVITVSNPEIVDSYFACYIASFLRDEMLTAGIETITIETVMSHPSKLDLIRKAHEQGYRVYLYYVTTNDSFINVERVKARMALGGHGVSEDKVHSRYKRSLEILFDAMMLSDRTFLFDNSGKIYDLVAEYDGSNETLQILRKTWPLWLQQYVVDRIF